jgi:hypothetical protein
MSPPEKRTLRWLQRLVSAFRTDIQIPVTADIGDFELIRSVGTGPRFK